MHLNFHFRKGGTHFLLSWLGKGSLLGMVPTVTTASGIRRGLEDGPCLRRLTTMATSTAMAGDQKGAHEKYICWRLLSSTFPRQKALFRSHAPKHSERWNKQRQPPLSIHMAHRSLMIDSALSVLSCQDLVHGNSQESILHQEEI